MIRLMTCPICEKEIAAEASDRLATFPFCSERCRNVDLLRWFDGRYRVEEPLDGIPDDSDTED